MPDLIKVGMADYKVGAAPSTLISYGLGSCIGLSNLESALVDTKKATNARESSRFLSGIGNINGRLIVLLNLEEIVGLPKEVK